METNEEKEPETESPQSLVGILNDEWEEAHGYGEAPPFEFRTDGTVDAIYFAAIACGMTLRIRVSGI